MPYTKEQLENNEYFQNLKLEANREYEDERNRVLLEFQASPSMETNTQVLRTGPGVSHYCYENPETNTGYDDPIRLDNRFKKNSLIQTR